ncbi:MAG: glycine zipper 2TM domain-containing protein [Gammaproteobacteria bacterium]|nr:glycine zipper 2TM domain-containing protein [Gammaproteobacteria bacterium]
MKNNTLAIALASLLVGGVAVAAFQNNTRDEVRPLGQDADVAADVAADADAIPVPGRVEYADVIDVQEITEDQDFYAQVLGVEPVSETTTTSTPRQVCEDVAVQYQAPTRDPNRIAGTTIGAVVGGALGNQIGGGDGRKLATVGGAVGGAFAGRAIQGRQQANNVQTVMERECRTVQDTSQSSRVVAYNVTYRNPDGSTGTMRTGSEPGERIKLGTEQVPVAWDVTYVYEGDERTVRMQQQPGQRLPVIDGQVVVQTAAVDGEADFQ